MLKLAIVGANGRMGQRLIALAGEDPGLAVAAALDVGDTHLPSGMDVLIDFSTPAGFRHWLPACGEAGVAVVSGTTGLTPADAALLDATAKRVPLLHATNMSPGVAVLNRLAAEAARMLGDEYDIEVLEAHHNRKVDAPSGTARTLLERLLKATGRDEAALAHGRHGDDARRAPRSIGVHALRMGDEVGTHTAYFAGTGERIELTHKATSRDTFAAGALRAARWLAGKPAGRYTIEDVVFAGR
ncbi:MAG: 4-hydroxy-tetrahydrodipicolinate reductase [Phycisphaerae bacterium]